MSFHGGSTKLANNMNRFDIYGGDHELIPDTDHDLIAHNAERLDIDPDIVEDFMNRFGKKEISVQVGRSVRVMPAFEARLRLEVLCENLIITARRRRNSR